MAGYIAISRGEGFSVSGLKLIPIAENTKEILSRDAPEYVEDIYQPYDYQKMIVLAEQSPNGFMAFYRATVAAYYEFRRDCTARGLERDYIEDISANWRELIELLERDERFSGRSFFTDRQSDI